MKFKLFLSSLVLLCVFSFAGCGKEKVKQADNFDSLERQCLGNVEENESMQNYWGAVDHGVAKGENGYYFASLGKGNNILRYMDAETKEVYPVCAKPNCSHGKSDKDCNALMDGYMGNAIYYYDGLIYLIRENGELVSMTTDGETKKTIAQVCTYNPMTEQMGDMLAFWDKYVFVYDINQHIGLKDEYEETITKYDLKTGEKVGVVVSYKGTGSGITNVRVYGDKLLFNIYSIAKTENSNEFGYQFKGLYVYDCKTSKLGVLTDKQVTDYCVIPKENKIVFFAYEDGYYSLDAITGEEKKLKDNEEDEQIMLLSYDGKNVFADNFRWYLLARQSGLNVDRKCNYYDTDMKEVGKVDTSNVGMYIYFGDEKFMFYDAADSPNDSIAMSYIEKGDSQWIHYNNIKLIK